MKMTMTKMIDTIRMIKVHREAVAIVTTVGVLGECLCPLAQERRLSWLRYEREAN
jgi:hypothetical protein